MKSVLKKVKTGLFDSKEYVALKVEVPADLDLLFYKKYYEVLSRLSNTALSKVATEGNIGETYNIGSHNEK